MVVSQPDVRVPPRSWRRGLQGCAMRRGLPDVGIVTPEEFEAKKAELLSRL